MSEYYELYQQFKLERDSLRKEIEELKSLIKEAYEFLNKCDLDTRNSDTLRDCNVWLEKAEKIK